MTRRESPGMIASRLHIGRQGTFSLSWEGLLDLAVDSYWTRRNDVRPVVIRPEGKAGKGHRRTGDAA